MARGTQHRKRRTRPNAGVATPAPKPRGKRVKHQRWEDQLFFSRLRLHAKWVFVLMILVFAVGFVVFGVGSGSTGISDVLQNFFSSSGSGGSSASALRTKADAHPKDPKTWRALATKLETDGRLDDAIVALKRYTALKPKDQDALEELAGIYLRRATAEQQVYIDAQTRLAVLAPAIPNPPPSTTPLGKAVSALSTDPLRSAVSTVVGGVSSSAYGAIFQFESEAVGVYKKLAKLSPKDSITQFRLAQLAKDAGDTTTAIAAYERFLALAPDDSLAPTARKALKQLKAQQKATATPAATKK